MLEKIKLNGLRLLDSFEAELGRLTVVIGANATGKSTLMEALQILSDCMAYSLADVLDGHGGIDSILSAGNTASELHWELTLSEPAKGSLSGLPVGSRLVYEVTVGKDRYGRPVCTNEVLRGEVPCDDRERPLTHLPDVDVEPNSPEIQSLEAREHAQKLRLSQM